MITWHPTSANGEPNYKFSIVIPTWNNLELLKLCVASIQKNSTYNHQIVIHINEGTDGTLEWVKSQGFDFTFSKDNVGVCLALNACRALIKTEYLVFFNDDMYALPSWDFELWKEVETLNTKFFFLSSTLIEPQASVHSGILSPYNYGNSVETFQESKLLEDYSKIHGGDWSGATWPPNIVHIDIWDLVGGYSIEYFPGLYSDPDFSMKLYEVGVRLFKGVGNSRVYHFGSKSTKRITMNNGSKQFLNKWGITAGSFTKIFLKRGSKFEGIVEVNPNDANLKKVKRKSSFKRFLWSFSGIGKTSGKYSYNIKSSINK